MADEVGVDVLPGGHDVALGAVTAPTSLFLSTRARGGREGGAASPPGLRLHVAPEVSYPGLGKVVPVLKSAGGWMDRCGEGEWACLLSIPWQSWERGMGLLCHIRPWIIKLIPTIRREGTAPVIPAYPKDR